MDRNLKYYKFINGETGNVIYFISLPVDECNTAEKLEDIRKKLAYEKEMFLGNIYYSSFSEIDFEE